MSPDEAREKLIDYWRLRADEAVASARSELGAGRPRFAINRAYYACFYAASALLLGDGRKFVRHAGVRAALHKHFVKTGRLDRTFGALYDRLFAWRQEADYGELVDFDEAPAAHAVEESRRFVDELKRLAAE
ncbi:MAG: HEPN domain-containing protein [Phycisphaerae bacterium]